MQGKKKKFVALLNESGGVASVACEKAGISYSTFRRWYRDDKEFAQQVDDCNERRTDWVESKLMERIDAGDVAATIFYLKTQGKKRGWTEKNLPQPQSQTAAQGGGVIDAEAEAKITAKADFIVKLLEAQNLYTPLLSVQVTIAAQLLVRTEMIAADVFADGHRPVNVEISREGNERESISPKERLYLDFLQQSQRALKALGLTSESRETSGGGGDELTKLLNEFSDGDK